MKNGFVVLAFLGVLLTSCGYDPQKMDSAYGSKPDEFVVDRDKYKEIIPAGYELARISKIEVYKSDSKVWTVTFAFGALSVGYKNLPKNLVQGLQLHEGDMVAVNKAYDVKKLPLYLKKVPPKPKKEDYHPEQLGPAYGGKGMDEMVPDWARYSFSPPQVHARVVNIDYSFDVYCYDLEGPGGYKTRIPLYSEKDVLAHQWHLGDIIALELYPDVFRLRVKKSKKAEQQILIPAAQWQKFIRGGKADGPLLKNAAGKTIEQAMNDGSFVSGDFNL